MAQINVIRDPVIQQTKIITSLMSSSESQTGENTSEDSPTDNIQTKVFGIMCPLLALNAIAVDYGDILYFELDGTGRFPKVSFKFIDRRNYFTQFCAPGKENELRVQIIPPFDNAYKKVDLTFYVDSLRLNNGIIQGTGIYKLPSLTDAKFKALGEKTTWELFDACSTDTGLGFASNTTATQDSRYMYLDYKSWEQELDDEIKLSEADGEHVYDWWVDWWNYLVLCNQFDRINNVDGTEDMMVWISPDRTDVNLTTGPTDGVVPIRVPCLLSNTPALEASELSISDYNIRTAPQYQYLSGNLDCVSVYEENKKECIDHLIQDSSVERDAFQRYEYLGEVYGDYNYLLAGRCRDFYIRKLANDSLEILMKYPMLSINRGDQVRVLWYDADATNYYNINELVDAGIIKSLEQYDLGWLADTIRDDMTSDNPICPNLQISGQWTVMGMKLIFGSDQQWEYVLTLNQPDERRIEFIPPEPGSSQQYNQ